MLRSLLSLVLGSTSTDRRVTARDVAVVPDTTCPGTVAVNATAAPFQLFVEDLHGNNSSDLVVLHVDGTAETFYQNENYAISHPVAGTGITSITADGGYNITAFPAAGPSFRGQAKVANASTSVTIQGVNNFDALGSCVDIRKLSNGKFFVTVCASFVGSGNGRVYQFLVNSISELATINLANPNPDARVRVIDPIPADATQFGSSIAVEETFPGSDIFQVVIGSQGKVALFAPMAPLNPTSINWASIAKNTNTSVATAFTDSDISFGRNLAITAQGSVAISADTSNKAYVVPPQILASGTYSITAAAVNATTIVGAAGDSIGKYGLVFDGNNVVFSSENNGAAYRVALPPSSPGTTIDVSSFTAVPSTAGMQITGPAGASGHGMAVPINTTHWIYGNSGSNRMSLQKKPGLAINVPGTLTHNEDTSVALPFSFSGIGGSHTLKLTAPATTTISINLPAASPIIITQTGTVFNTQILPNGSTTYTFDAATIQGGFTQLDCTVQNCQYCNGAFNINYEVDADCTYKGTIAVTTNPVPTAPSLSSLTATPSSARAGETTVVQVTGVAKSLDDNTLEISAPTNTICSITITQQQIPFSQQTNAARALATATCAVPKTQDTAVLINLAVCATDLTNGLMTCGTAPVTVLPPSPPAPPGLITFRPKPAFIDTIPGKIAFAVAGLAFTTAVGYGIYRGQQVAGETRRRRQEQERERKSYNSRQYEMPIVEKTNLDHAVAKLEDSSITPINEEDFRASVERFLRYLSLLKNTTVQNCINQLDSIGSDKKTGWQFIKTKVLEKVCLTGSSRSCFNKTFFGACGITRGADAADICDVDCNLAAVCVSNDAFAKRLFSASAKVEEGFELDMTP